MEKEHTPDWADYLDDAKKKFSDLLGSIERSGVKRLEWSEKEGFVDIVFQNDTRRSVNVGGDSETAFMQDVLKHLH